MKISLILPTLGRKSELLLFLDSLILSTKKLGSNYEHELIVIDQNPRVYALEEAIEPYKQSLNIIYLHSDIKGLSVNRNIGLNKAEGDIVCFPDDDCTYYENSLEKVIDFFEANENCDVVLGRIFDRSDSSNILKAWPASEKSINSLNVYFMSSSITIFARRSAIVEFDESLGAGSTFGSCEDPDFLYRILQANKNITYTPSIEVWHPKPDMEAVSLAKVKSYASGFGYFVSKELSVVKIFLLFMLLAKKLAQLVFFSKHFSKGYFKVFFSGLYSGILRRSID